MRGTTKLKAFVSWSGGKESALSYYRAMKKLEVTHLLNMVSKDGERSRTHGLTSDLLKRQSEAIGIPVVQRKTSWEGYEKEFKRALSDLKQEGVETGVFGDIDLAEHREWIKRVCGDMGIKPVLPLWREQREELLKEFIEAGFKSIVCSTQANLLGKEWLGREIDAEFIADLKAKATIDLCGEKGEYHTFVFDGPIFQKPLSFSPGKKILQDNHWFLNIILE